jgi:hypothetical protein
MNNIGIIVFGGLGNQLFKIFAVISYYIDNCQNYILYLNDNGYRKYYWDTIFSNISHKVSNEPPIPDKYTAPFFHYKEISILNNDTLLDTEILENMFINQIYSLYDNIDETIDNKFKPIKGIDNNIIYTIPNKKIKCNIEDVYKEAELSYYDKNYDAQCWLEDGYFMIKQIDNNK